MAVARFLLGWAIGVAALGAIVRAGDGFESVGFSLIFLFGVATPWLVLAIVRDSCETVKQALIETTAVIAAPAVAVTVGLAIGPAAEDARADSVFYGTGLAIAAAWLVLVVGTAFRHRARWNTPPAIAVSVLLALFVAMLLLVRSD